MRRSNSGWVIARGAVAFIFLCGISSAAVVLDGTLGAKGALVGPKFSIDPSKGKRVGTNQFYSFSTFDLAKGQTASFTGNKGVKNILARVTGGRASNINGTLQVVSSANFYLINPAGVIFGPDAALDINGSFAVTTADELRFAGGGKFSASHPEQSVLTTAAPAAFGF